jgi:hypothetical protein
MRKTVPQHDGAYREETSPAQARLLAEGVI